MFIAIPASIYTLKSPEISSYLVFMPLAGGVGLSIGLAAMFVMLQRQKEEIGRLRKLIPHEDDEKI